MQRHPFFRLSVRFAGLFERVGPDPYRPPFLFGTSRLYPLLEAVTGRFPPVERWLPSRRRWRRSATTEPDDHERGQVPRRARPGARASPGMKTLSRDRARS
jgi:hypothetical protein